MPPSHGVRSGYEKPLSDCLLSYRRQQHRIDEIVDVERIADSVATTRKNKLAIKERRRRRHRPAPRKWTVYDRRLQDRGAQALVADCADDLILQLQFCSRVCPRAITVWRIFGQISVAERFVDGICTEVHQAFHLMRKASCYEVANSLLILCRRERIVCAMKHQVAAPYCLVHCRPVSEIYANDFDR